MTNRDYYIQQLQTIVAMLDTIDLAIPRAEGAARDHLVVHQRMAKMIVELLNDLLDRECRSEIDHDPSALAVPREEADYFADPANRKRVLDNISDQQATDVLDLAALHGKDLSADDIVG